MTPTTGNELILNVDDNEGARYAKSRILKLAGFRVIEAATGAEALESAARDMPSLMLLDVMLPDINGLDVCRMIKQNPATLAILVLQTSASAVHSRDRVTALAGGADSYLIEPIEPEELIANVKALLRIKVAEQALIEADKRKDEFLAMLAHELRNPLAPIRNAVELLRLSEAQQSPLQIKAREIISRQVDHLSRLVDELLDVSRITHGKISLVKEPISLSSVIRAASEAARPLIEQRRHTFDTVLPMRDVWLSGDPIRLSQVLSNLLNNAAKYTPPQGHIVLTAAATDNEISISVRDNGEGIAADLLPHVFDLFMQANPSLDRAQGGLGVGLSLAQTLAHMHGGAITAVSAGVGLGSEFTLRTPIGTPAATQRRTSREPAAPPPRARRILLIEDSRDAAEGMAMLLSARGHHVQIAFDGVSGLAAAKATKPDLIILDIGLPNMDGYQLARELRNCPDTAHAKLIALSGYGQQSDKQKSQEAGIDHHLVKPIALASLEAAIDD